MLLLRVVERSRKEFRVSLAVSSYPTISQKDFDWIQSVRDKHDELYYKVINPHFTFVFPVFDFDRRRFIEHVYERSREARRIPFVSRCAVVVKDVSGEYTHVFLVPDEGFSDIVKLHDKLYEGPLAPQLRLDIPFIPHIGIANALEPMACKERADALNRQAFSVEGVIEALEVVELSAALDRHVLGGALVADSYEQDWVTTIERIELRS
jgi:2'-5' RNA ligase superfamily